MPVGPVDLDALVGRLAARGPGRPPVFDLDDAREAAVLVALAEGPGGAEVLLTKRSKLLSTHQGEVSFPGGRLDPGESAVEAALREAYEEVGLDTRAPRVLGELDHHATVSSRSRIVPIVAVLDRRPDVAPTSPEVERVLHVPLLMLLRPGSYREERWGEPPLDRAVHFFELDDETVWGATARILVQLLAVALGVEA
jgi:8-oxo-dGTP pyrophosphatase MutT (NUDIX family)